MRNQSHATNGWLWGGMILLATLMIGVVFLRVTEPGTPAMVAVDGPDPLPVVPLASNRSSTTAPVPATMCAEPSRNPPRPYGVNQTAAPQTPLAAPPRRAAPAVPKSLPRRVTPRPSSGGMDNSAMAELKRRIATNFRDALAYCGALPADQQGTAYHMLFARWMQQDPAVAVQAAQELPESLRAVILSQALTQLAATNPEALLAILASDTGISDELRSQYALRALSQIGRRDPVAALQALAAMPLPDAAQQAGLVNQILSHWIVADQATALAWLQASTVDDVTYDTALVSAIGLMLHRGDLGKDAASLFREFVESGRMDHINDPDLRAQAIFTAKSIGVALGSKDYAAALQWGFELPADSSAQAYVLSNVAFSQTHGTTLPDISWVASMEPGFARTRVVAAVAYGRLLASGASDASQALRRQLDGDVYNLDGIRTMVEHASLAPDEKKALMALF